MNDFASSLTIIGDSLCKGVVFSEEKQQYVFLDNFFINSIAEKYSLEVNNLSKFGATLPYGVSVFRQRLKELSPDAVLIEFGMNDSDYKWDEILKDPYIDHYPNVPQEDFEEILNDMLFFLYRKNIQPVLMTLPPVNADAYFNWITHGDAHTKQQLKIYLNNVQDIAVSQEMYSQAVKRIAEETHTPLVDVREKFLCQNDFKDFICRDGIHPNKKGYGLIRDIFEQALEKDHPFIFRQTRQNAV